MLYKLLFVNQNKYLNNEFKFVIFKNKNSLDCAFSRKVLMCKVYLTILVFESSEKQVL